MNYTEMKAAMVKYRKTRAANIANLCCGCGVAFTEYGMTRNDAYVENGKCYCSSHCCDEQTFKFSERDELDNLTV